VGFLNGNFTPLLPAVVEIELDEESMEPFPVPFSLEVDF